MKLPRRQFLHLAAGAAALPVGPRIAFAQAYPTRPVRLIVGLAAGGARQRKHALAQVIWQIIINSQFASQESLAFGMLLADGAVELGQTGHVRPFDRSYDCLDGFRFIRPRLFDGRLVAKIPIAWHDVLSLTASARSRVIIRRAARSVEISGMQALRATGKDVAISGMLLSNLPMGQSS